MEFVMRTNGLKKQYRKFTALNGLTMNVPKGSIYGFVGRNGAGKTTLIRIITGLQIQNEGDFELYGAKSGTTDIYKARGRMGAIVETPSIHLDCTAEGNMRSMYRIMGLPIDGRISEILELVGLGDTGSKKAKNFSLGMRQRLGIAMALCSNPDFLILDEPINGLDPQGIIEIRELILKLNKERNITVLISSHILDELSKLATHYGFIDKGRILLTGYKDEILESHGILRCAKDYVQNVVPEDIVSIRTNNFGAEIMVSDRESAKMKYRDTVIDPASLDDIMLYYVHRDAKEWS